MAERRRREMAEYQDGERVVFGVATATTGGTTTAAAQQDARRTQAHALLLAWYAREGRATLLWRHTRDPYAVLVSEMMLQQTQVERVLPKYQAFLARFPTLAALAAAPVSEVIKQWAGLGYNLRAVRLHGIAQQAVASATGALPDSLAGLLALKGIGRYTAGAVACFGLGLPVATVDTNIRRVLWRVFNGIEPATWPSGESAARAALALAEWALPTPPAALSSPVDAPDADIGRIAVTRDTAIADPLDSPERAALVYDWQQALMDLGALVCQSRRPACERCPLTTVCVAYAEVAQVTLFPSGAALARLRDERAEAARLRGDDLASLGALAGPALAGAPTAETETKPFQRRVAEARAGYGADSATARPSPSAPPIQRKTSGAGSVKTPKASQPFANTTRYFRGRIVDALRALPTGESLTLAELGPQVKPDFAVDDLPWLRALANGLARDGLAQFIGGDAQTGDGVERIALP